MLLISNLLCRRRSSTPSTVPFAKSLLLTYAYFSVNVICYIISYATPATGHNNQLILSLRMYSMWGLINGVVFLFALACGTKAYNFFFSYLMQVMSTLYDGALEFMTLFLIAGFASYLNATNCVAMLYGIANAVLNYFANKYIKEVYDDDSFSAIATPKYQSVPTFVPQIQP